MKDKELNMKIPEQPRLCCRQCALGRVPFQGSRAKSRASLLTILGVVIVTLAGLVLGNLGLLESMYEITLRSK